MKLILQPKLNKVLDKSLLKLRPLESDIARFKAELLNVLDHSDPTETEEFHKNLVSGFLTNAFYAKTHFINTKGRQDLVIHNGKDNKHSVGVIIEAKRPKNKSDWFTPANANSKALQELVLYYLRERIECKNIDIKYLVATNIEEWYIIEASYFDKLFYQNKKLVKDYEEWRDGKKVTKDTGLFYRDIAGPVIAQIAEEIPCTYFNLKDHEKALRSNAKTVDRDIIALYKILSPYHLLKVAFTNDSNELDQNFYKELLHIIGLEEAKEGGKNIIRRKVDNRNTGSLLEKAIDQLQTEGLHKIPDLKSYGATTEEQYFAVGLELCITWVNRILFLKLLEGQLINYHKGDQQYRFLNSSFVNDFDELFTLFHNVLAIDVIKRKPAIQAKYSRVPYLNSSLFEISDLEDITIKINAININDTLEYISTTVLKEQKKKNVKLNTLEYLFSFLDAYDFASEGTSETQEDNKTLINASVLGKVFEKINGYKDGSIYTPGFITMYMSRQSIRLAVLQKFNDACGWSCKEFSELENYIEYQQPEARNKANAIINDLKICDPAVGSGHFLVSALNEIIAIKSELKILQDVNGKRLKEYSIDVVNDELLITDEDNELYTYNPQSQQSQLIQQTLFTEKQTIIENCLFGVDINPNSVKICRLRLWIELLKNAYYKPDGYLETLPNIDINIKCGNSLLSRFSLDADLSKALKSIKYDVSAYRGFVNDYKNCKDREVKRGLQLIIDRIKADFRTEITKNDPLIIKLNKANGELYNLLNQATIFDEGTQIKKANKIKREKLEADINKWSKEVDEIKNNAIYKNAFEWRFEFPEVLNNDGDFVGFDIIIGNPPYVKVQDLNHSIIDWYKSNKKVAYKRIDISILFFELAQSILKPLGGASFISSNQFLVAEYGKKLRQFLLNDFCLTSIVDYGDLPIFADALTYVSIFELKKDVVKDFKYWKVESINDAKNLIFKNHSIIDTKLLSTESWVLSSNSKIALFKSISTNQKLSNYAKCSYGIVSGADDIFIVDEGIIKSESLEPGILLPLVRAQNCFRYNYSDYNLLIIYPYKLQNENTILLNEDELKTTFPNAYRYLLSHKVTLENRRDSRKTFENSDKWYSLTRFGQINIFKKDKIVFPGEQKSLKFSIDKNHSGFSGARVFAITILDESLQLKYLLALLNSKLIAFVIKMSFPLKQGGYFSMSSKFIDSLPIILVDEAKQLPFVEIVNKILNNKEKWLNTTYLEQQIDALVYKLYNLTPEEIAIVEASSL